MVYEKFKEHLKSSHENRHNNGFSANLFQNDQRVINTKDLYSFNYDNNPTYQRNKNRPFRFGCFCKMVLFVLFFTTLVFVLGSFYNFYFDYEYDKVFENVKITSRYEDNVILLQSVQIELKHKQLKLTHRPVPTSIVKEYKSELNFIEKIFQTFVGFMKTTNNYFDFKMKHEDYFHLFTNKKTIDFRIKKLQTNLTDVKCVNVTMTNNESKYKSNGDIEACIDLKTFSWYGGHESYNEPFWPINNQRFEYRAYVTGFPDDWGAVVERYWLSSAGLAIFIDDDVPLLVNHSDDNKICFKSSVSSYPYVNTPVYQNKLQYTLCTGNNLRDVHMYMVNNYLGKPSSSVDLTMMKSPIWTTWNYYFKEINQSVVLDFASQIVSNNYSISQLEIDDKWEVKYGDLDFDKNKFPDPLAMTSQLHSMGTRATLWVHPFCNVDSVNFPSGATDNLWVLNKGGTGPGLTSWWDGVAAGILDTTNPKAVEYFTNKLNYIKSQYGIDSFKFDAGETHWIPKDFYLHDRNATPDVYSRNYVKMAANQGNFIEVRTANRIQNTGVFFRILDRAGDWSIKDGLKSVITETLQFGLLGYPFVLPDMIGGNSGADRNQKELFIRWTELNAFLPAMQFGIPPWFFDDETTVICKKWVDFHETTIFPYLKTLVANFDGEPLIRPMWWIDPTDKNTFNISDQFVVGDSIIVAPVLDPGVTSRTVYLPVGSWYDPVFFKNIQGPKNFSYPVTLDSIPFFYTVNFWNQLNSSN